MLKSRTACDRGVTVNKWLSPEGAHSKSDCFPLVQLANVTLVVNKIFQVFCYLIWQAFYYIAWHTSCSSCDAVLCHEIRYTSLLVR